MIIFIFLIINFSNKLMKKLKNFIILFFKLFNISEFIKFKSKSFQINKITFMNYYNIFLKNK